MLNMWYNVKMKTCPKCGIEKDESLFSKRRQCKKCLSDYQRAYFVKYPEKRVANDRSPYIRHGLTREQYDALLAKYDGKCWACRERKATNIDHDHNCCPKQFGCVKCVRGALCHHCNTALGLLSDDHNKIEKLKQYILG